MEITTHKNICLKRFSIYTVMPIAFCFCFSYFFAELSLNLSFELWQALIHELISLSDIISETKEFSTQDEFLTIKMWNRLQTTANTKELKFIANRLTHAQKNNNGYLRQILCNRFLRYLLKSSKFYKICHQKPWKKVLN